MSRYPEEKLAPNNHYSMDSIMGIVLHKKALTQI